MKLTKAPIFRRVQIAMSDTTCPVVLAALSRDPNKIVRLWVAGNVHTPTLTLHRLAADPCYLVAQEAKKGLNTKDKNL